MKRFFPILGIALLLTTVLHAQDKSKRPSPPDKVSQKLKSGATISIDYSRPSVKGRTIGTDLEPMKNQVWRMGANEATVFETNKEVTIEGQTLAAGKYSMFGVWEDNGFRIIFNSAWNIWGTQYDKNRNTDVLSVTVPVHTLSKPQEQLLYTINKNGKVTLEWGTIGVSFQVK